MRLTNGDEFRQFSLSFEFDFQFGDVKVFGITELSQKNGVNQFGDTLGDLPSIRLFRHFKENDLGWRLGVDKIKQVADAVVFQLLFEEFGELFAEDRPILKGVT